MREKQQYRGCWLDKTRQEHVSRWFVTSFAPAVASHHAPTEWCGVSYAGAAMDTLILYSQVISLLVMALNALPAIFTKLNFFFMLVDIPSEKQASSSRMYSLNVALRHLPIF
jgi:hypothetical protein